MAIAKRLWCKRLLEYFCLVQVLGDDVFWVMKSVSFAVEGPRRVNQ